MNKKLVTATVVAVVLLAGCSAPFFDNSSTSSPSGETAAPTDQPSVTTGQTTSANSSTVSSTPKTDSQEESEATEEPTDQKTTTEAPSTSTKSPESTEPTTTTESPKTETSSSVGGSAISKSKTFGFIRLEVVADPPGADKENLNEEKIIITNKGAYSRDIGGYYVSDADGNKYRIPHKVTLDPGEKFVIHTGSGTDTDSEVYWGSSTPIWDNTKDEVTVKDNQGTDQYHLSYQILSS